MIRVYNRGAMYSGIINNRLSFLLLGNKSGHLSLQGYEAKSVNFKEKNVFLADASQINIFTSITEKILKLAHWITGSKLLLGPLSKAIGYSQNREHCLSALYTTPFPMLPTLLSVHIPQNPLRVYQLFPSQPISVMSHRGDPTASSE